MDPADLVHDPAQPCVLRGGVSSWPAVLKWTAVYLAEELPAVLTFRMGQRTCPTLQWERDCPKVRATVMQLLEWLNPDTTGCEDSPFADFPAADFWAYADYMYASTVLEDAPHLLEDLAWPQLAPSLDATQCALWIGSPGAYTPCHYDTYGFNIVVQIRGRKTWLLFPPEDSPRLYPTRVPLEESTVYSRVHVLQPAARSFPLFAGANPREVTLEAGDVLYVPRHWWHSVRTEESETSISANLWIDQPALDNRERFKEAITSVLWRAVDDTFAPSCGGDVPDRQRTVHWASDEGSSQTFSLLQRSFEQLSQGPVPDWLASAPPAKRTKLPWTSLLPLPPSEPPSVPLKARAERQARGHLDLDRFLRAATHPRVVELLAELLDEETC